MGCNQTLILCYHRVAARIADPFGLCVHPENFAAHLDELNRSMEITTLDALDRSGRRRNVVVTFDDGYADNLRNAVPIAEAAGVPITVFVTSGVVGRPQGFWWDRLASLLRARPPGTDRICLELGGERVTVPLTAGRFGSDLARVHRALSPRRVEEIERGLDTLEARWSTAQPSRAQPGPTARAVSLHELVELASSPLVTLGAHTVDHVRLKGRPMAEQLETVAGSKRQLEEMAQRPITHFAYPFGGSGDFDGRSVAAARCVGFDTACTTIAGVARPGGDRFRLPRRVVLDWGRGRFRAQLQRWRVP